MATRDTGGGQQRANRQAEETDEVTVDETAQSDVKERHDKISDDVDALLDDIDDVLEENAEEFVKGYIQKGGQ